jgi:hypothetical protein
MKVPKEKPLFFARFFHICAVKKLSAVPVIFLLIFINRAVSVMVMVCTECTVLCEKPLEIFFEATCETKKSMALHLEILTEKPVQRWEDTKKIRDI